MNHTLASRKPRARARQVVYWPGIDREIEDLISKCQICEKYRNSNCREPFTLYNPDNPFNKINCDICEVDCSDYLFRIIFPIGNHTLK